jgi:hypothetical protein
MGLFWKMKIIAFVEVNSDLKYATKQRVFAIRFLSIVRYCSRRKSLLYVRLSGP